MGPVEVRIALDGNAARVLMSAEQAPTRQWLEQALPTLAAGLREAGLTLAGGGVFERAPDGQGGQGGRESARSSAGGAAGSADGPAHAPAQGPALPRRRGVVDLVA
jgi:flagellar hook-length control protein FliK